MMPRRIGRGSITALLFMLLGEGIFCVKADSQQHYEELQALSLQPSTEAMTYDTFGGILRILQTRLVNLRECFTHDVFHDIVPHDSQVSVGDFIKAARAMTNIVAEKACSGTIDSTTIAERSLLLASLREVGYESQTDVNECFSENSLAEESGDNFVTAAVLNMYLGNCLLPEKAYFDGEFFKYFENGLAPVLSQLNIGEKQTADDHAGHDHAGEDEHDHDNHEDESHVGHDHEDHEGHDHEDHDHDEHDVHDTATGTEGLTTEHNDDHEGHDHDDHDHDDHDVHDTATGTDGLTTEHHDDHEGHDHEDHDHDDHDVHDTATGTDGLTTEHHDDHEGHDHEDHDHDDHDGHDTATGTDGLTTEHHDDHEGHDHEDHDHDDHDGHDTATGMEGLTTEHHDDHRDHEDHDHDDHDDHEEHDHDDHDDHEEHDHDDHENHETVTATGGLTSPKNTDSDHGDHDHDEHEHIHSRRRRSSHFDSNPRCYTSEQITSIYGIEEGNIPESQAMEICPVLVQQILSGACTSTATTQNTRNDGYTQAMVYAYGTAAAAVISLLALLALILFPVWESETSKMVMQFFVGLGIGTLASDALIHIIPKILGVHDHSVSDDHDHAEHEEDLTFVWQMSLICCGLYIVFLFENSIKTIKKSRQIQQKSPSDGPELASAPYDKSNNPSEDVKFGSEEMLRREDAFLWCFTPTLISVFIGDILHNFADGVAIGIAFAASWAIGLGTSVAVLCHELPHEFGDFAIYLRNGASKWQAVGLNFGAACCTFIGLYAGINMGSDETIRRWLMCIIAGIFLYIALVQVMSLMLKDESDRPLLQFLIQNIGMLLGWAVMLLIALYEDRLRNIR